MMTHGARDRTNGTTEPVERSARRRRGRPFRSHPGVELTREDVLDAAFELARSEELSAITIHRVAKSLDVSRTPIYGHVANADELRLGVLDRLLGQDVVEAAEAAETWERFVRTRARRLFDVLDTYPGVAGELFRTGFPDTEIGRRLADEFVSTLRTAGFDRSRTPSLILAIVAVTAGSVMQIHGARRRDASMTAQERTAAAGRRGTTLPPEPLDKHHFEHALGILIAGMRAELGTTA